MPFFALSGELKLRGQLTGSNSTAHDLRIETILAKSSCKDFRFVRPWKKMPSLGSELLSSVKTCVTSQ